MTFQCYSCSKFSVKCCPIGWESYSRSCYWFEVNKKSQFDAERSCIQKWAHLVTLNSKEEAQFITETTFTNPAYPGSYGRAWIGLNYENGVWQWKDRSSNYFNWLSGPAISPTCGEFHYNGNKTHYVDCTNLWDSICEKTQLCLIGWESYGDSCYWFEGGRKTQLDAERACIEKGAQLITLNSKEEAQYITETRLTNPAHPKVFGRTWIGLNYENGIWQWNDQSSDYFNWLSGPSISPTCGEFQYSGNKTNHVGCNNQWDSVCEINYVKTTTSLTVNPTEEYTSKINTLLSSTESHSSTLTKITELPSSTKWDSSTSTNVNTLPSSILGDSSTLTKFTTLPSSTKSNSSTPTKITIHPVALKHCETATHGISCRVHYNKYVDVTLKNMQTYQLQIGACDTNTPKDCALECAATCDCTAAQFDVKSRVCILMQQFDINDFMSNIGSQILIMKSTPQTWVQDVFGVNAVTLIDTEKHHIPEKDNESSRYVRDTIEKIHQDKPRRMKMMIVREKDKLEPWFRKYLVEDRTADNSPSYVDFLCHIHKEIRNILG